MLFIVCVLPAVVFLLSGQVCEGYSMSMYQDNGKVHIVLDGKNVDLENAKVIKEDDKVKVLSPIELEGAQVVFHKDTGKVELDYKGTHFSTQTPEEIKANSQKFLEQLNQSMLNLKQKLAEMRQHLMNSIPVWSHWY